MKLMDFSIVPKLLLNFIINYGIIISYLLFYNNKKSTDIKHLPFYKTEPDRSEKIFNIQLVA